MPIVSVKLELKDKGSRAGFRELLRQLGEGGPAMVDVGVHPLNADIAVYASANEFGAWAGRGHKVYIPPRSFIRSTIDEQRKNYDQYIQRLIKQVFDEKLTVLQLWQLVGLRVQRDIQRKIVSNVPPPNAASTVRRKGSDRTLVDTGALVQAVRYAVKTHREALIELGQVQMQGTAKTRVKQARNRTYIRNLKVTHVERGKPRKGPPRPRPPQGVAPKRRR